MSIENKVYNCKLEKLLIEKENDYEEVVMENK